MNGVDILAMEEVAVEFAFNWTWFWIVAGGLGVLGLIISGCLFSGGGFDWTLIPELTISLFAVGLIFGTVAGAANRKAIEYETQYKVIISDEVTMADFLEKYEIIETEGKIYTVREK